MNGLKSVFIKQACTDILVYLVLTYMKSVTEPKKACFRAYKNGNWLDVYLYLSYIILEFKG